MSQKKSKKRAKKSKKRSQKESQRDQGSPGTGEENGYEIALIRRESFELKGEFKPRKMLKVENLKY